MLYTNVLIFFHGVSLNSSGYFCFRSSFCFLFFWWFFLVKFIFLNVLSSHFFNFGPRYPYKFPNRSSFRNMYIFIFWSYCLFNFYFFFLSFSFSFSSVIVLSSDEPLLSSDTNVSTLILISSRFFSPELLALSFLQHQQQFTDLGHLKSTFGQTIELLVDFFGVPKKSR